MGIDSSEVRRLSVDMSGAPLRAQQRASLVVRKTAYNLEGDIKHFIGVVDAIDTGNMLNGVSSDIDRFSAEVGPTADYAHFVNNGTSMMAPRHFIEPAAERRAPLFARALGQVAEDSVL